jgi:hypothetical protein
MLKLPKDRHTDRWRLTTQLVLLNLRASTSANGMYYHLVEMI